MKKNGKLIAGTLSLVAAIALFIAAVPTQQQKFEKVAVVSMRSCLENSQYGKNEKARLETMNKKMQETLEAKEKELNDLTPQLKEDHLETLSPEAEKELKTKFQNLSQEMSLLQNQYYQLLNQMQGQIIQKLHDMVQKASAKVSAVKKIDLVLSDEIALYFSHQLDVSEDVIKELDIILKEEEKKAEKKEEPSQAKK